MNELHLYRLDLRSLNETAGWEDHPARYIKQWAPETTHAQGESLGDCWLFVAPKSAAHLPPWITDQGLASASAYCKHNGWT